VDAVVPIEKVHCEILAACEHWFFSG
jgi:hypothetical protein